MNTDKEFYDLLSSISQEQTFTFDLFAKEIPTTLTCKQLTTFQLKELIKTAVDSPLTQAAFNSTVIKIFKDSLIEKPTVSLNIVDRLLFVLETRIHSLSPHKTVEFEGKTIKINFEDVKKNLKASFTSNASTLANTSATEGKITVNFGIPLLDTELQLNEELYKNIEVNIENLEELRKIVGEAFINEIAKSIQTISIEEKTLTLASSSFKNRLKAVESLPASLIQKVIEYVESYKKIIGDGLTINGYTIPIDSTLFTLR